MMYAWGQHRKAVEFEGELALLIQRIPPESAIPGSFLLEEGGAAPPSPVVSKKPLRRGTHSKSDPNEPLDAGLPIPDWLGILGKEQKEGSLDRIIFLDRRSGRIRKLAPGESEGGMEPGYFRRRRAETMGRWQKLCLTGGFVIIIWGFSGCATVNDRMLPLSGAVYDMQDLPCPEIEVFLYSVEGETVEEGKLINSTETDIHGRFQFEIHPEREYKLICEKPGMEPAVFRFHCGRQVRFIYVKMHSIESLFALTEAALDAGDWPGAKDGIMRLYRIAPESEAVIFLDAVFHQLQGDAEESRRLLKLAAATDRYREELENLWKGGDDE